MIVRLQKTDGLDICFLQLFYVWGWMCERGMPAGEKILDEPR